MVVSFFSMFTPKIGEDEPIFDLYIFQMGWFNHQPEYVVSLFNHFKQIQ